MTNRIENALKRLSSLGWFIEEVYDINGVSAIKVSMRDTTNIKEYTSVAYVYHYEQGELESVLERAVNAVENWQPISDEENTELMRVVDEIMREEL